MTREGACRKEQTSWSDPTSRVANDCLAFGGFWEVRICDVKCGAIDMHPSFNKTRATRGIHFKIAHPRTVGVIWEFEVTGPMLVADQRKCDHKNGGNFHV